MKDICEIIPDRFDSWRHVTVQWLNMRSDNLARKRYLFFMRMCECRADTVFGRCSIRPGSRGRPGKANLAEQTEVAQLSGVRLRDFPSVMIAYGIGGHIAAAKLGINYVDSEASVGSISG